MANYLFFAFLIELVILADLPTRTWTARTEMSNIKGSSNHATNVGSSESLQTLTRITRSPPATRNNFARQRCPGCTTSDIGMKCTRKSFLRARRYAEELKCQPEPTLIKLQLPGPDYSVEPSLAKVSRCSGFCRTSFHGCTPLKTSFVKIPVILIHHLTGGTKCVEYEVEQHDSCSCGCEIQEEHCSHLHKHEHCSCKCINQELKYRCLEQSTDVNAWDEDNCKCNCQPKPCQYGLSWDADECRCNMNSGDDVENLLY